MRNLKRFGAFIGAAALLGLAGCGQPSMSGSKGYATAMVGRDVATFASLTQGQRQVIRIFVNSRQQLDALAARGLDLFENVDLDKGYVDATATVRDERLLRSLGFRYQVLKNADQFIKAMGSMPSGYHTVADVRQSFQKLAADNPSLARYEVIGKSVNGQDIFALRVSSKPDAGLPQILINSGQHARELPPVELTYRLAHHLVGQYGRDPEVTELVDARDIWIVPVVNPDGRENVQNGDTYWRKNMKKLQWGARGVDTNRNSNDHWEKGNGNPWADDYHGPAPESEPETQAMRDLVASHKFTVSLDIHNYAGMVLWPPGFDNSYTPDEPTFSKIGNRIAGPIGYRAGTIANTIYRTYGDFSTWQYQKHGVIAFGAELDDSGFNAPFSAVEKDWQEWKGNLMLLIKVADDPRKRAQQLGEPASFVGFRL